MGPLPEEINWKWHYLNSPLSFFLLLFLAQPSERSSHLILMSRHKSKQWGQVFANFDTSEERVKGHCGALEQVHVSVLGVLRRKKGTAWFSIRLKKRMHCKRVEPACFKSFPALLRYNQYYVHNPLWHMPQCHNACHFLMCSVLLSDIVSAWLSSMTHNTILEIYQNESPQC